MSRYENNEYMKFWQRMSFYPPGHLFDEMNTAIYQYEREEKQLFIPLFKQAIEVNVVKKKNPEHLVIAFIALLNAITVELVYGGMDRAKEVVEPSFEIFWDGIALKSEGAEGL